MAKIKPTTRVCLPALLLLGAAAAACFGTGPTKGGDGTDAEERMAFPVFLTPVAEAEEDGIDLYWLGPEFEAGGLEFVINVEPVYPVWAGPGLSFSYGGDLGGNRTIGLSLDSFSGQGGGGPVLRQRALDMPGTTVEKTQVGRWAAEVLTLPSGTRPVNELWLYVDMGETVVVVSAPSGKTGVPGTDGNPLIDKDLLIEVVAEHLRPYPE